MGRVRLEILSFGLGGREEHVTYIALLERPKWGEMKVL
jgi:hypothetical protein